jgi:hypothetical protein
VPAVRVRLTKISRSQVVEALEGMDNACAYFYLGQGHVQSAGGLAISLISQLCDREHLGASLNFFASPRKPLKNNQVTTKGQAALRSWENT